MCLGPASSYVPPKTPLYTQVKLNAAEKVPQHPFTDPDHRKDDLVHLRAALKKFIDLLPSIVATGEDVYLDTIGDSNEDGYFRVLVTQLSRLLSLSSFFVVGFMGFRKDEIEDKVRAQIWDLDEKLLTHLKASKNILCYLTFRKSSDGQFANVVILDHAVGKDAWMMNATHHCAMALSNKYYNAVRIHNFNVEGRIHPSADVDNGRDITWQPIRTTYVRFVNDQTWWRGVRTYVPSLDGVSPGALDLVSSMEISSHRPLRFGCFMGDVAFNFHKQIAHYIGSRLGVPVEVVPINAINDVRYDRMRVHPTVLESIEEYSLDFSFVCGTSFAKLKDELSVLVAPVRSEARYKGQPICYCDVIMKTDDDDNNNDEQDGVQGQRDMKKTIQDLQGSVFGYNKTASYSGYHILANYLLDNFNLSISNFFMEMRHTSTHASSIQQVLSGHVTCAAVASVVLDMERSIPERSEEFKQIRVVDSLGPVPMPPLVCRRHVSSSLQSGVRDLLMTMHETKEGEEMLSRLGFMKWAPIEEKHYHGLRFETVDV
eukprot:TRINITY_DN12352_c0_g1_i2.p1 TRINITY_DN12352_c0_g1~~TRINITY_DN12352_c0_g1_i2.p1  ORF type:complete len:542 (+),score=113.84 TRINITY_DN12352_c0_g1_i2:93-1718(+)